MGFRQVIKIAKGLFDSFLLFDAKPGRFNALLYPGGWQAERACQLVHGNTLFMVGVQTKRQIFVVQQTPKIISGHMGEVPGLKAASPYKTIRSAPESSEPLGTTGCLVYILAVVRHGDVVEIDGEPLQLIGNAVAAHRQTVARRDGSWAKLGEFLHGSASRIPIRRVIGGWAVQFGLLLGDR